MWRMLFLSLVLLWSGGCVTQNPPRVVKGVDWQRYAGTWYEIARYPNRFEKGCRGVTASYRLLEDGRLEVINRCRRNGRDSSVTGRAKSVDDTGDGKLKVSFFPPFYGHYWVIDLAGDYSWAVVGHPRRKYLWILARQPHLPADLLEGMLLRIAEQGYDTERLIFTEQP
jgi:apolipoprotein D and lipocalin family protein